MFELSLVMMTIGAVLFSVAALSLVHCALISLILGIGFFVCVPTRKGVFVAIALVCMCFIGVLTLWAGQTETPAAVYGDRVFDASVISIERQLNRTVGIVRDTVYGVRIRVTSHSVEELLPGDSVRISGIIERPQDFVTDTNRLFHYEQYVKSKHIQAVAYSVTLEKMKTGRMSISRAATILRYWCAEHITRYVSYPYDGIVSGMVFGYQGGIPESTEALFRSTGVLHVLVLSGYNITLLAGLLMVLLRTLPHRAKIVVVIIMVIVLVMVSGAEVAAVRAGVMGIIGFASMVLLHRYNAFRALCVAYLIFFFYSPTMIFFDPGFHLSFLAALSMIVIIPKAEGVFWFIPVTRYINLRELIVLALVMPLVMLPYTVYFSGAVPLSTVAANIVLSVVTPAVTVLGMVLLCVSWVTPLGMFVGTVLSFVIE